MKGVTPELVTGGSVTIGRRRCPVKQVGQITTRQDRRDFTSREVVRAMTRLGSPAASTPRARREHAESTPVDVPTPLQTASALLGGATSAEV